MRKLLVGIIETLDDTPAVYGVKKRLSAGQTLVETALIVPILIVLVMGLIEIGWFANNYLSLLDVTRAGARYAATLTDQFSPISWNNASSYVDYTESVGDRTYLPAQYRMPYSPVALNTQRTLRIDPRRACFDDTVTRYFYSAISCLMITTLAPLEFDDRLSSTRENGVDDIVISAFSLELVIPEDDPSPGETPWLSGERSVNGNIPQMAVVGRYPTNANECDVIESPAGSGNFVPSPLEPRDPFDFNGNNLRDIRRLPNVTTGPNETFNDFDEIVGFDVRNTNLADAEKQRGFVFNGHMRIPGTSCLGSRFSTQDIEDMFNFSPTGGDPLADNFEMTNPDTGDLIGRRERLPSQGVVLVEMQWQHDLLLESPIFNPVYNAFGSVGYTTIYVWAAFPLPSVEPFIEFP